MLFAKMNEGLSALFKADRCFNKHRAESKVSVPKFEPQW